MPMLAEPKKKSRVGLNPRGTLWTNDENKFGQKLLEKMGWAKGKGLGKDQQGCQEPIRVSMNNDNKGVGFKGNSEDWSHHYQGFEDALANLNSINNTDFADEQDLPNGENTLENIESLELKSKKLKSRVHYKKFTQSKDLSRYNENDLASVLGVKRVPKEENNERMIEEADKSETLEETEMQIGQLDKSHGLTTVYGGNLKDYFNQKMVELKRKREEGLLGDGTSVATEMQTPSQSKRRRRDSVPSTPFPDLEFEPEKTDFSFNISQEPVPEPELECQSTSPEVKKKKKKSKENNLDTEEVIIETEKVKKKLKKEKNEESDKENLIILQDETIKKDKRKKEEKNDLTSDDIAAEGEVNENEEYCNKKKKKHKHRDVEEVSSSITENEMALKKKKKKKKMKDDNHKDNGEESIANKCDNEGSNNNQLSEDGDHLCKEMNVSYLTATSKEDKKKKNKNKEKIENEEEEQDSRSRKSLKKLRKLASEISLPDILKSTSERAENIKSAVIEDASVINSEVLDDGESKSKIKISRKRSFKEIKTEIEEKIIKKVKKKSKKDMEIIEEEEEGQTSVSAADDQVSSKVNSLEATKSSKVTVMVPVKENEEEYGSKIKTYKAVKINLKKLFPGSNLPSIAGYSRARL